MRNPFRPVKHRARWPYQLLVLCLAVFAAYFQGLSAGLKHLDTTYKEAYEAKIQDAFERGQKSQAWVDRIMSDRAMAAEFCHRWWFDLDHTQRTIEPQRKLKNGQKY